MAAQLELILTEDVEKLGKAGELVKVKHGYARNFLLPKGVAIVANKFSMAAYEERKAKLEADAEARRTAAESNKTKLDDESVVIEAKAGESGKLFGSITKEDIVKAVKEQKAIDVDKDGVKITNPIRTIGEHAITIQLLAGITANMTVNVSHIK
jgi:large subunit ribosomal protein L9